MPSVMVLIFLVELVVHFINAVGASAINNMLWTAVNYLPISTSKDAAKQRKLQAEYLKVRGDLNATSSQDEFARWAKLRRQHDKLLEQLETTKKGMEAAKSRFENYLTGLRMVLTRGPQYFLPFWYGKEPMFWLPHGWFPYWAEWVISFPRAPLGSASSASWQLACTGVISLFGDAIVGMITLALGSREQAMPMPAAGAGDGEKTKTTGARKTRAAAAEEKKEL